MPAFLPHEIDPEAFFVEVNVPFLEHLEDLVQMGLELARERGKVVLIYQDKEERETDEGVVYGQDVIAYRDYEPDWFAKCTFNCPKDADDSWSAQNLDSAGHPKPRPFPSMLITPQQGLVVSKPSLCEGCVHRVSRGVTGNCHGKAFEPLPALMGDHANKSLAAFIPVKP